MNELIMQLILGVVSVVITICVMFISRNVTRWLNEKQLLDDVKNAVNYAEQMWKISSITKDERKAIALDFLVSIGVNVSEEILGVLIESVVGGINIASGKTDETMTDPVIAERLVKI